MNRRSVMKFRISSSFPMPLLAMLLIENPIPSLNRLLGLRFMDCGSCTEGLLLSEVSMDESNIKQERNIRLVASNQESHSYRRFKWLNVERMKDV